MIKQIENVKQKHFQYNRLFLCGIDRYISLTMHFNILTMDMIRYFGNSNIYYNRQVSEFISAIAGTTSKGTHIV